MADRTSTQRSLPAPPTGCPSRISRKTKTAGLIVAVLALTTGVAGTPSAEEGPAADVFEAQSLVGSYLAGRIAQGNRDSEAATQFLSQVLEQDPDNEIVLNQAFLSAAQFGDFAQADALAAKLIRLQPANRIARLFLGIKAFRERNWAEADKQFKDASASPIGELTSSLSRAWVAVARGDTKGALDLVEGLKEAEWTRFYRTYNRALVADVGGDTAIAPKAYEELFAQEPRTVAIALAYSSYLVKTGDVTKARDVLKTNVKAARIPHPMPLVALDGLRLGRPVPALVSNASQGLSQVFYGLGESLANEGGLDLAAIYVQLALRIEPTSALAIASLASVQEQSKQYARAIETYERLPQGQPLSTSFALRRSLNLSALEKPDEAKDVLAKLLVAPIVDIPIEDPPLAPEFVTRAKALPVLETGARGEAVKSLQQVLAAAGFSAGAADGAFGKSTQDAVRLVQSSAKLSETGDFDAATGKALTARLEDLAKGKTAPPSRATEIEILTSIGDIQRGRKEFADSIVHYDKAIALIGTPLRLHWDQFYARGISFERTKQWPKAEADFLKALALNPDEPSVLNYLGYSWVDQGQRMEEALEMIKKAVALKPDDGYIVDSLGWAYYKLGRYDDAVAQLERAVELRAEDSVLNDHLGDAFWRAGRRVEARFQWSWALTMKPEPDEIPKLQAKMKDGLPDLAVPAAAVAPVVTTEPAKTDTTKTP